MLHVLAPTQQTTSSLILQLARVSIRQSHQFEHCVVVLGSEQDARYCKSIGLPVLGSIGGPRDQSRTLQTRLTRYLSECFTSEKKIMAWGFDAMLATNRCSENFDVSAFVDEVDLARTSCGMQTCMPTSPCGAAALRTIGFKKRQIAEPVFGIEPCPLVVDAITVRDTLRVQNGEFVVSIVGDFGDWKELLSMAVRLQSTNINVAFVLPHTFVSRVPLFKSARSHGISDMFIQLPSTLRQIDVLHAADCAWCPANSRSDRSCGVLAVLEAASVQTPLAVQCNHPVSSIPSIGSQIAWAENALEVAGWMLEINSGTKNECERSSSRVSAVRTLTTPSRFVENLFLRTAVSA